jgi:ribosomal protein L32
MAHPKRKISKSRRDKRRTHKKLQIVLQGKSSIR